MSEPWFNPNITGILSPVMGVLGAITVVLSVFVAIGKAKKLVLSFYLGVLSIFIILLIIGIVAYFSKKPYLIWY